MDKITVNMLGGRQEILVNVRKFFTEDDCLKVLYGQYDGMSFELSIVTGIEIEFGEER